MSYSWLLWQVVAFDGAGGGRYSSAGESVPGGRRESNTVGHMPQCGAEDELMKDEPRQDEEQGAVVDSDGVDTGLQSGPEPSGDSSLLMDQDFDLTEPILLSGRTTEDAVGNRAATALEALDSAAAIDGSSDSDVIDGAGAAVGGVPDDRGWTDEVGSDDGTTSTDTDDTEEVFVILPETMGEEIPVVETRAFEPADEELDARSRTVTLDDVDLDPGTGEDRSATGEFMIHDEEDLDEIACDLDDDALRGEGAGFEDGELLDLEDDVATGAAGGRRWVLSLVALVVLGIGGFSLYSMFFSDSGPSAQAEGAAIALQLEPPDGLAPGDGFPPVGDGAFVDGAANGAAVVLQDRVVMALNLGFQVEDSNE